MAITMLRYCVSCWTFDGKRVQPTKLLEGLPVCKACYASMPPKARMAGGFYNHLKTGANMTDYAARTRVYCRMADAMLEQREAS